MEISNQTLLFEAFNMYYNESLKEKEKGNLDVARLKLLRAAEAMYGLAKASVGELKTARIDRADRLVKIAESMMLSKNPSNSDKLLTKSFSDKSNASKNDKNESNVKSNDDTETDWQAAEIPNVHFSDVAGLDEVKEAVNLRIILPRKNPEIFKKFKKKMGGGVLMYGPPGTGKSMIAKAIACEVGAKFYSVRCSDIVSKWFGEAEKNIKNLFDTARQDSAAVIFFDEFESLGAKRGGNSSVMARIIPELLSQIQGFSESDNTILLLAATNRPWDIDTAFLRPGRFNELLYIPLPDKDARRFIIDKAYKDIPISSGVVLEDIVEFTEGFNGADIVEFCEQTKNGPIRRALEQNLSYEEIQVEDIDYAKAKVKSSVAQSDLAALKKFMENMNNI